MSSRPPILLVLPFALAIGLSGLLGCSSEEAAEPPRHLFLITVDTLRADHLGSYGYGRDTSPNLDLLADQATFFENAITPWPKTGPAMASMFIGRYPSSSGLVMRAALRLPQEYVTLAELLREQGFTTLAVVSNPVLAARLQWDQGFDEYLETWDRKRSLPRRPSKARGFINGKAVNKLALPLLERYAESERLFVWLHYSDPHGPYILPKGFDNPFLGDPFYTGEELVERAQFPDKEFLAGHPERNYHVAQYDANIWAADHFIGRALERARSLGLLEDAMVLFSADHGESLGEKYYFGHGRLPYNAETRVPLFISGGPFSAGIRVDSAVGLVDLYPTLRDLFAPDREIAGLEGRSLLQFLDTGQDATPPRLAFAEAGNQRVRYVSAQDTRWKLVRKEQNRRVRWEMYDLLNDPDESFDILARGHPEVKRLGRALVAWRERERPKRPSAAEPTADDEETRRALRALGYLD